MKLLNYMTRFLIAQRRRSAQFSMVSRFRTVCTSGGNFSKIKFYLRCTLLVDVSFIWSDLHDKCKVIIKMQTGATAYTSHSYIQHNNVHIDKVYPMYVVYYYNATENQYIRNLHIQFLDTMIKQRYDNSKNYNSTIINYFDSITLWQLNQFSNFFAMGTDWVALKSRLGVPDFPRRN